MIVKWAVRLEPRIRAGSAVRIGGVISDELLEILACPKCHSKVHLNEAKDALICDACRLRYRIDDGIPVMLIEEAESF
jgi:uncharacterized protein YbaR (Trm112 family)